MKMGKKKEEGNETKKNKMKMKKKILFYKNKIQKCCKLVL